jgi:hypothetical protein
VENPRIGSKIAIFTSSRVLLGLHKMDSRDPEYWRKRRDAKSGKLITVEVVGLERTLTQGTARPYSATRDGDSDHEKIKLWIKGESGDVVALVAPRSRWMIL